MMQRGLTKEKTLSIIELSAKDKLIRAAESLFAHKGIEATSLREIAVMAGQKNKNAVQYHFTDKKGLITAIWQRHASKLEAARTEYLSQFDDENKLTLDELVASIIYPISSKLDDPDGGRHYIQIMSRLITYSEVSLVELFDYIPDVTNEKIMIAVAPYVSHLSDAERLSRMLLIAGLIFHGLADYIHLTEDNNQFSSGFTQEEYIHSIRLIVKATILADQPEVNQEPKP